MGRGGWGEDKRKELERFELLTLAGAEPTFLLLFASFTPWLLPLGWGRARITEDPSLLPDSWKKETVPKLSPVLRSVPGTNTV